MCSGMTKPGWAVAAAVVAVCGAALFATGRREQPIDGPQPAVTFAEHVAPITLASTHMAGIRGSSIAIGRSCVPRRSPLRRTLS